MLDNAQPKQLWYIHLRVADEKKVANTSMLAEHKRKYQNETQETNSQPIQRTSTIEYKGHGPLSPETFCPSDVKRPTFFRAFNQWIPTKAPP